MFAIRNDKPLTDLKLKHELWELLWIGTTMTFIHVPMEYGNAVLRQLRANMKH